jgi:hexosaminidase
MRGYAGAFLFATAVTIRAAIPPVFPIPQEMELTDQSFVLDASVRILLPVEPTAEDLLAARELMAEASDRYGVALPAVRVATLPETGRSIVLGARSNPLVQQLATRLKITIDAQKPGPEGYVLHVDPRTVLVAGNDEAGAFYGVQSLRQLITKAGKGTELRGASIRDWPHKPFRAVKLYLPGRDHIAFFKRFVRDFMALHKYNQLVLETNAAMRLDRHPELNAGWIEFARDLTNSRRDRPAGPRGEYVDSTHYDTGDGAVLEKEEVADLVRWARQYHIDVILELPSLSHSYYLLTRHRELAEMPGVEWPDAYCPSNPKSYELLFDVLDEYIDVIKPRQVHVGHDEWRILLPTACPLCRGKDLRELFADDLNRIHEHLAQRGVGTVIWGDHLIESVRGRVMSEQTATDGHKYYWPGALSPDQVRDRIPKDILIANWFWREGKQGEGEMNEVKLEEWGFRQFFGNFTASIRDWERRSARTSVIGGAPSSWAATTEFNFGKDLLYDFLGCANLLWSKHWPEAPELRATVQALMPDLRQRLSGRSAPSTAGDRIVPVTLAAHRNARLGAGGRGGTVAAGPVAFGFGEATAVMRTALGETSPPILIGDDPTSIVFLHACEKPARNEFAYHYIFNFEDSADLLGHYEVLYEDGFVAPIPVRYGVNILEQTWTANNAARAYCYQADPVACGEGTVFFAYEWTNPRLGKMVKSVSFKGSSGFKTAYGQVLKENAVLLKALSIVKPRPSRDARDDQRVRD